MIRYFAATLILATLATLAKHAGAQQPPATDTGRTTLTGVFTAEQAARGKNVYYGYCRSCHSAESITGSTFAPKWGGHTLAEYFQYISTEMPQDNPGSREPDENADVVAYLLSLAGMPAGMGQLAPDSTALATIRIRVPEKPAGTPPLPMVTGRSSFTPRRLKPPNH